MPRNGSLPSTPADHAERSSARLLTPVELADLPGRERSPGCDGPLTWSSGVLVCPRRGCTEQSEATP
jgi:hypothetical protein